MEGDTAPSFTEKDVNGNVINFPGDFKGKLVLLSFWSRNVAEGVPDQVKISEFGKKHGQTFSAVGIDVFSHQEEMQSLIKEGKVPPSQIFGQKFSYYETTFFQGPGFAVPTYALVDGNNGNIISIGNRLDLETYEKDIDLMEKGGSAAVDVAPKPKAKPAARPEGSATLNLDGTPCRVVFAVAGTHEYETAEFTLWTDDGSSLYFETPIKSGSYPMTGLISKISGSMVYTKKNKDTKVYAAESWDSDGKQFMRKAEGSKPGSGNVSVKFKVAKQDDKYVYTILEGSYDVVLRYTGDDQKVHETKATGTFQGIPFRVPLDIWNQAQTP